MKPALPGDDWATVSTRIDRTLLGRLDALVAEIGCVDREYLIHAAVSEFMAARAAPADDAASL